MSMNSCNMYLRIWGLGFSLMSMKSCNMRSLGFDVGDAYDLCAETMVQDKRAWTMSHVQLMNRK